MQSVALLDYGRLEFDDAVLTGSRFGTFRSKIKYSFEADTSYNNRNPVLGVLWSWHRVASPPIEIPIQIWKKKFADKLHKSYKKHPWQTSPTFSGHFTLQAEPKINWNNYISMVLWACFSNKVCIYQKNKQPKWQLLWSRAGLGSIHELNWNW